MGGTSSKTDHLHFALRESLQQWPLHAVDGAWQRWFEALQKLANTTRVGLRDFLAVFSDYSIIVDATYLTLPMTAFAVFAPDGRKTIDIVEPLLLTTLFSTGEIESKLCTLYKCLAQQYGKIDKQAVLDGVGALLHATFHAGITDIQPKPEDLAVLASKAFALFDVNHSGDLTEQEFIAWSRGNMSSQALLHQFTTKRHRKALAAAARRAGQEVMSSVGAAARAVDAHQSHKNATRQEQSSSAGAEAEAEAEAGGGAGAGAGAGAGSATARGGDVGAGEGAAGSKQAQRVKSRYGKFLNKANNLDKRRRLHALKEVAQDKVLQRLARLYSFSLAELHKFARAFVAQSGTFDYLERPGFKAIVADHMPVVATDDAILDRLFSIADVNGDERVSFREFVAAFSRLMRGSLDDKLELLFEVFATPASKKDEGEGEGEGEAVINVVELVKIVKLGNQHLRSVINYTEEIMAAFDENNDGDISLDEFCENVKCVPQWLDMFLNLVPMTPALALALHRVSALHSQFNFESLQAAVTKGRTEGAITAEELLQPVVTAKRLTQVLDMLVGVQQEHVEEVNRLCEALTTAIPTCTLRDLLNCCCKALCSDRDKQVRFLFFLYDTDGGGSLDRHEIMHMLLTSQRELAAQATLIMGMLASFDEDGDGAISLSEFKHHASRQPLMLTALEAFFAVKRASSTGIGSGGASLTSSKGNSSPTHKSSTGAGAWSTSSRTVGRSSRILKSARQPPVLRLLQERTGRAAAELGFSEADLELDDEERAEVAKAAALAREIIKGDAALARAKTRSNRANRRPSRRRSQRRRSSAASSVASDASSASSPPTSRSSNNNTSNGSNNRRPRSSGSSSVSYSSTTTRQAAVAGSTEVDTRPHSAISANLASPTAREAAATAERAAPKPSSIDCSAPSMANGFVSNGFVSLIDDDEPCDTGSHTTPKEAADCTGSVDLVDTPVHERLSATSAQSAWRHRGSDASVGSTGLNLTVCCSEQVDDVGDVSDPFAASTAPSPTSCFPRGSRNTPRLPPHKVACTPVIPPTPSSVVPTSPGPAPTPCRGLNVTPLGLPPSLRSLEVTTDLSDLFSALGASSGSHMFAVTARGASPLGSVSPSHSAAAMSGQAATPALGLDSPHGRRSQLPPMGQEPQVSPQPQPQEEQEVPVANQPPQQQRHDAKPLKSARRARRTKGGGTTARGTGKARRSAAPKCNDASRSRQRRAIRPVQHKRRSRSSDASMDSMQLVATGKQQQRARRSSAGDAPVVAGSAAKYAMAVTGNAPSSTSSASRGRRGSGAGARQAGSLAARQGRSKTYLSSTWGGGGGRKGKSGASRSGSRARPVTSGRWPPHM